MGKTQKEKCQTVGGQVAIGRVCTRADTRSCLRDDCICKELGSVTNPRSGAFATLTAAIKRVGVINHSSAEMTSVPRPQKERNLIRTNTLAPEIEPKNK